jgi:hypothetical protein
MTLLDQHALARKLEQHELLPPEYRRATGVYCELTFEDVASDGLSTTMFLEIESGAERMAVWWQHPRHAYAQAIKALAAKLSSEREASERLAQPLPVKEQLARRRVQAQARLSLEKSLMSEGIDHFAYPGMCVSKCKDVVGMRLVAPVEVRTEDELASLALLARNLVEGKTALNEVFEGLRYGRAEWLADRARAQSLNVRYEHSGAGASN